MTPQQQYIEEGRAGESETGIPFRTPLRERSGKLSHIIMPSDLRQNQQQQSSQSD